MAYCYFSSQFMSSEYMLKLAAKGVSITIEEGYDDVGNRKVKVSGGIVPDTDNQVIFRFYQEDGQLCIKCDEIMLPVI